MNEGQGLVDMECPYCGRQIHCRIVTDRIIPDPGLDDLLVNDLSLSVRTFNCLFFKPGATLQRSATLSELLNLEYPQVMPNFGKVSFCEIVAVLEAEVNYPRQRIQNSRFWKTAPGAYRNMIDTAKFAALKEEITRWKAWRHAYARGETSQ